MLRSTELIINSGAHRHILKDTDLADIFQGSTARRYALVNKALKKGELIRLCRGYYTLANRYLTQPLDSNMVANRLVPHSYVSGESALSFHNWIPERVQQTISVCAFGRNRRFATPIGEFLYYKTSTNSLHFYDGVELHENQSKCIYVASPLRALMDYIYIHKLDDVSLEFLTGSLRIEREQTQTIEKKEIAALQNVCRSSRVHQFLLMLNQELYHE